MCTSAAAPLYEERKAIINGDKEVPVPKEDEEGEPNEDEGPVPAGIPEFWLGVLRANRMLGESVRFSFPSYHFRVDPKPKPFIPLTMCMLLVTQRHSLQARRICKFWRTLHLFRVQGLF